MVIKMIDISDYLNNIFDKFSDYISESNKLCELKKVNFNNNQLPDYSKIHLEELYILKYDFAYGFEYKYIFSRILPQHKLLGDPTLKILSIGCGNYIDYWGIASAVEKKGLKSKIIYDGIDSIDWNYKFEKRPQDSITFYRKDIVDFLSEHDTLEYNCIIFPKSIGEFSNDAFRSICSNIKKIKFKTSINLIVSLRSSQSHLEQDMARINDLVLSFKNNDHNKFSFPNYKKGVCSSLENKAIISYDSDFCFPENIKRVITSLSDYCVTFRNNNKTCSNCESALNRYPILKTQNILYKIIRIEKVN